MCTAVAVGLVVYVLSRPPSVLLITIDTLRPDRLGCYGHPTNATPAIDRLAREGMLFEHAYCDIPWTTGSMSSVMTGQYGSGHGLRLPTEKLSPTAVTMAERLHDHGFQTAAIIGSFPLDSVYGLDQGFETYDDEFSMPMINDPAATVQHVDSRLPDDMSAQAEFVRQKFLNDAYRPDEDVTDAAIRWLDGKRQRGWFGRPFLLWVHYFGPHEKLFGDRSFVAQEPDIIAAYDADVQASDRAVGRLLDHLRDAGLLDRTVVILGADHGQNLGEYDYVGHSMRLDEVAVRIPLIVRYPARVPAGLRRTDIARNVDILPTVLEATRVRGAAGLQGRSLLPSAADPDGRRVARESQIAYFETYVPTIVLAPLTIEGVGTVLGPVERHGVRTPDWKLVVRRFVGPCAVGTSPTRDPFGAWTMSDSVPLTAERCAELTQTELYRTAPDAAGGIATVASPPADVVATLQSALDTYAARRDTTAADFSLSAEQERKLKSLGYLQ